MANNNNNNRLLAPPIFIDTSQTGPSSSTSECDNLSPDRPFSSNGSFLTAHSPVSMDGETLRSRANSFNSNVETLRSRSDSTAIKDPDHVQYDDVPLYEALKPDQRNEKDFQVDKNPFAFTPGQLNKMLNPKSLAAFRALGGLRGLERGLRTDLSAGLSLDESQLQGAVTFDEATKWDSQKVDNCGSSPVQSHGGSVPAEGQFADRIRVFQQNRLPERKGDGFLILLWRAYNDKIIILLTAAAVVSLSLGLYETFTGGSKVDWIEGVAICVAILIVTVVTAANDWQKERQFIKLNRKKSDRDVKAIRSGKSIMISVFDITVGDILHLEPGDAIPADGVFLSGHGVKCDESSATGESDQMKKTNGHEVWQRMEDGTATKKLDPFILSGSKVLEGVGTYLVTSVGPNSTYGKIMLSLQTTNDPTPLQVKLGKLADWIGGLGLAAALVLFFALLIRFLVQLPGNPGTPAVKGREFTDILIVAVTVIVVAIPEGLPLAVTLALAFATARMVKENNLVRILRACETMGNATVICSDKTGTLTQNKMTVVAGTFGTKHSLDQTDESGDAPSNMSQRFAAMSSSVRDLLLKAVALNSTAFEGEENGQRTFIGSKTEVAMLQLAEQYLGLNLPEERANAEIVQMIPFDSARKCMGVVVRQNNGTYRLHVKGAAEMMLAKATKVICELSQDPLKCEALPDNTKSMVLDTINSYAQRSLRSIGIVYKDFEFWPPPGVKTLEDDKSMADFDDVFHNMVWVGVVGIQDPLRPEVPGAIEKCNRAGVQVKMVTGDNMTTAVAIATECGIKTPDGIAMEGPKFRQLSDEEMDRILPNLQVLARSSPEDKRILVARLKHLGETVAVTGDGTNDGPALRTADVGFSMGIAGTEVAKEASSIILLDDNFKSIVTAICWGRAVNDAVARFLQFQITVNITAVCLAFVSALANEDNESVLNAVQLLWVNLIMDTFAALALATDAPTEKILDRKPTPKSASLFTMTMWKMIIGQSIYQLIVTFTLYFAGAKILNYDVAADHHLQEQLDTIVFNTFVWMQIFNEFNNRRLDNKFNIFEGIHKNYWFIGINVLMVGGQVMIIFVGDVAIGVERLNGEQWAICILCAIFCLPWAIVLRCIPDRHFAVVFNGVLGAVAFVWKPIAKAMKFVFSPVRKAFSATWAALRRFCSRIIKSKKGSSPEELEIETHDEEAPKLGKDKEEETPRATHANLPPITLTGPS
ncbi:Calcium transporting P-type ATPase, putative [Coccidioides posadasii C735 delta SOWgp]|uniref:Calcium-transporting ATPase n=2 Tax=Coccidioides posadasii TaxID=199306 RepID=A0A0J6IMD7_COCPO|nr:Calcium transporting P-type ATPase, putative [Coccidioides posadasii C735 delta SOWgp]EER26383.1 Calcium transporting P-type ATPase, putative [Coccidioides posadasii C735 delta SOWgp]KMM73082.1 plasma membrane calcium-transporting ATPase 4 [Coccidioides posadasii RMSCC 3488]|eukprot:XP_003068528.1 Calcium transporting P-type ATPase, putative [Coccidioides posadasii C735 delta SOWgp]